MNFVSDFSDLFPNRDITRGTLTVMTLAQRTENDMSEWTEDVDKERDEVMGQVCGKRKFHYLPKFNECRW